jgi:hypothetical protein
MNMANVEYAFLADAAQIQPGQKFSVLGGGISRLAGQAVPFVHPHLALVVGLRLGPAERNREHELGFRLTDPEGADVATAGGKIVAHGPADPSDVVLNIAVDLWNLNLRVLGEHVVRIAVDGTERKRLPLTVAVARENAPEQRYLA